MQFRGQVRVKGSTWRRSQGSEAEASAEGTRRGYWWGEKVLKRMSDEQKAETEKGLCVRYVRRRSKVERALEVHVMSRKTGATGAEVEDPRYSLAKAIGMGMTNTNQRGEQTMDICRPSFTA